ncbi:MAG: hypothetical protein NC910_02250 [Candidatus Omnitrophica bacterium]|nr:hypothetical protein [Candidatus Omnitrophota bacterium]
MSQKWLIALIAAGFLFVIALLGCVSWPLTSSVRQALRKVETLTGWRVSVQEARWAPWRLMRLTGLRVEAPTGGCFSVEEVRIIPRYLSVVGGNLSTRWEFDVIRADAPTWGIQKESVLRIASSDRGILGGFASVQVGSSRFVLDRLVVQGGLMRADARGWLSRTREMELSVEGAIAKDVLRELELVKSDDGSNATWEPFQFRADGTLGQPSLSFISSFLSFSLNTKENKAR